MSGDGPINGNNGSFGSPKKKLILTLAEQGQILPWVCIIKMKKVFFIKRKEIFMFKTDNKNVISATKFY